MAEPRRGEIWLADLNPTRGREQRGRRPVLVVSVDLFNAGQRILSSFCCSTSRSAETLGVITAGSAR